MSIQTNTKLLAQAAKQGNLKELEKLIAISDPTSNDSEALLLAATWGHTQCVERLIPVSNPNDDDGYFLIYAAQRGQVECLQLLLPYCDAKLNNSLALQCAVIGGHWECVDALYAHSDVHVALTDLDNNNARHHYEKWQPLRERWESEQQQQRLTQAVGLTNTASHKGRNKI